MELIKYLSTVFNDVYKQRLPKNIDQHQPMLSLLNSTGQSIFIDHLNGLEVILLFEENLILNLFGSLRMISNGLRKFWNEMNRFL